MTDCEFSIGVIDISHFCASISHPPVILEYYSDIPPGICPGPHFWFICIRCGSILGLGMDHLDLAQAIQYSHSQASLISLEMSMCLKSANEDQCSWTPCICLSDQKSSCIWMWVIMKLELPLFIECENDVTYEEQQSSAKSRDRKTESGTLLQASALS